jgi:hypothetical protein
MKKRMKKILVVHDCSFIMLLVECLVPTIRTLAPHPHISSNITWMMMMMMMMMMLEFE